MIMHVQRQEELQFLQCFCFQAFLWKKLDLGQTVLRASLNDIMGETRSKSKLGPELNESLCLSVCSYACQKTLYSNMPVLQYILSSNLLIFQKARAEQIILELDDENIINRLFSHHVFSWLSGSLSALKHWHWIGFKWLMTRNQWQMVGRPVGQSLLTGSYIHV